MAIPTDTLFFDFNPATYSAPDGAVTTITADGATFTLTTGGTASLVSNDGPRHLVATMNLLDYPNVGPPNVDPLTFAYLVVDPVITGPDVSYFSRHAATLSVYFYEGTMRAQDGNVFGDPIAPVAGPMVVMGTKSGPQGRVYLNNVLKASTEAGSGYAPAGAPAFIPSGKTYRVLFWNRVLSTAELSEVYATLMATFNVEKTITWEAPPSTSPILEYLVRTPDGAEVELGPNVTSHTLLAAAGAQVQILARSAAGLSTPVQVTL